MTPTPAPEIIMDANGNYWRNYPEHLSMVPTTDDNEPVPRPWFRYRLVRICRWCEGDGRDPSDGARCNGCSGHGVVRTEEARP